jgi:hypothetical protein
LTILYVICVLYPELKPEYMTVTLHS